MNAPQQPQKRRRIAGESKPGEVQVPAAEVAEETVEETTRAKLAKPKLPKRPKASPAVTSDAVSTPEVAASDPAPSVDLPAAPPRPEAVRVPRQKPSVALIGLLVVAIASLGFAGFGIWSGVKEWRADNIATTREAAADAAGAASETIFTYQYNKLDEHLRASQKVMTPSYYTKKYKIADRALRALAPQRRIQMRAVVRNAATVECGDACSPDKATVLVFYDEARVALGDERPTVFGKRIEMSMVKNASGTWLVNDIKAL